MSKWSRRHITEISGLLGVIVGVVSSVAAYHSTFIPSRPEESGIEQQFDKVSHLATKSFTELPYELRTALALQGERELVYAQKLSPDDHRVPLLRGLFLYVRGDAVRAAGDPNRPRALGETFYAEAVNNLERALRRDPKNSEPYVFLALLHASRGAHGQAEEMFEKALRLRPRYTAVCAPNAYAGYLAGRGRRADAKKLYDEALSVCQESVAIVRSNRAANDRARGEPGTVFADLEFAVRTDPENSHFLRNLGDALADAGQFGAAEEALRRSLALGKNSTDELTFRILANLLLRAGRSQEAEAMLDPVRRLATVAESWRRERSAACGPSNTATNFSPTP